MDQAEFAWMLYRSVYGRKRNQEKVLKIRLSRQAVAHILSNCACKHGEGGTIGRVQWDPARDLYSARPNRKRPEQIPREPQQIPRERAIQIGVARELSHFFVENILKIEDVTTLAHRVGDAHATMDLKSKAHQAEVMDSVRNELPNERSYMPECRENVLVGLGMLPGETAKETLQ